MDVPDCAIIFYIQVMIWQQGDPPIPEGYSLTHTSISGTHSGDLNVGGTQTFIATQRVNDLEDALINGSTIIDDICIFYAPKGGEELPDDYFIIDKNLNRGLRGNKLFFGYHQRSPMGLCDMRYEYNTLDRYPVQDHNGLELPVNELPMFTFPHDLRIKICSKHDFPLPDYFTFVFTDVQGRHLHAACLRFFEVVPFSDVVGVFAETFRKPKGSLVIGKEMEIVCPKVICVLSQMPFYRAMGRFLRQLYSLSLSPMVCPIERFLTSTVAKVPLPLSGGRPLHIVLDAALISIMSKAMAPISLELPSERSFPPMDLDFAAPLRCLSVENLLTVFCLLLREEKIVFLCRSNSLLTEVMETFRSLLFPLRWSSCFITRLPDSLCALLEAPGGLMIGLYVTECIISKASSGKENSVSFVKIGNKNYEKMGGWSCHIPAGSYIVDLSENVVLLLENRSHGILNTSKVGSNIIKVLPSGPRKRIEHKLLRVASDFGIAPQLSGLDQFDSPFEIHGDTAIDAREGKNWDNFPTLEIRDAFVVLMADILGNVSLYSYPPSKNIAAEEYRSFAEEFDVQRYISDADKSCRQLLGQLVETQMFSVLLQTRSEGPHNLYLDFFEKLSEVLHLTGLSALSSSDRRFETISGHVPPLQLVDVPASLHTLMSHYQKLLHTPSVHRAVKGIHSAGSFLLKQYSGKANGYGNKLLDELMIHVLTPEFRPPAGDFAHLELDVNTLREKSRYELETGAVSFSTLQDITKGPLLLPGPCVEKTTSGEDGDIVYIKYESGWPALSRDLLNDLSSCHPRLESIAMLKREEFQKKDKFLHAVLPSMEERISLLSASPLVFPMRQVSIAMADMYGHSLSAISMVLDIYSLSITTMCLRVILQDPPSEQVLISQIFEIFGVLAQVEGFALLPYMEENVLRSVLLVCGMIPRANYSDYAFFHAACCVVFELMQSTAGISHPCSLTSGTYTCALSRFKTLQLKLKKKTDPALKESRSREYCHLEDIGVAWFAAKSYTFYPEFSESNHPDSEDGYDFTPEKLSPTAREVTVSISPATPPSDVRKTADGNMTPNSSKRLWSRFLKKELTPPSVYSPQIQPDSMPMGGPCLALAKELKLGASNSALMACVRVRCVSSLCNDLQCASRRTASGDFEYKFCSQCTKKESMTRLLPWGHQEVVDYVCGFRNQLIDMPRNGCDGALIRPIVSPLNRFAPGLLHIVFSNYLFNYDFA